MGLRFIRITILTSHRLLYVLYILLVEGASHYHINFAVDRSITRIGSSQCRRNGKVLTSRTLRDVRLQDAATKVGVVARSDCVKVGLVVQP